MRRCTVPLLLLALLLSISVTAFSQTTHTITINFDDTLGSVSADPPGGVITHGQAIEVDDQTYISVTASPDADVVFDGWFVNESATANSVALSENFYVTSAATIEARFTYTEPDPNETVSTPVYISGPSQVEVGESQTFTYDASSSIEGNGVEFMYDWGDGSPLDWGPASQTHTWMTAGNFPITVKARSINNPEVESALSAPYNVEVIDPNAEPVDEFTLETLASPSEFGYVSRDLGKPLYASGDQVLLTAVANAGYVFSHWEENSTQIAATQSLNVTIYENRTITAIFNADTTTYYQLDIVVSPSEAGWINRSIPGPDYTEGTVVNLVAAENEGYVFKSWSLTADGAVYSAEYSIDVIMDGNKTIFANYEEISGEPGEQYELTFSVEPSGSGIVRYYPERNPALYDPGEVVNLVAEPNPGYIFSYWGGDAAGGADTNITIDNDKHAVAYFAVDPGDPGDPGGEPGGDIPAATANMPYYHMLVTANTDDTYEFIGGPHWLTLQPTGEFGGMPAAADVGDDFVVSVTVYEVTGNSYTADFFLDVMPESGTEPPVDEFVPPAFVGEEYYFMVSGHPAGTQFNIFDGPPWLTIDPASGVFGGVPSAADIGNGMPIDVNAVYSDGTTIQLKFFIDVFDEDGAGEPGDEPLPPAVVGEPYQHQLVTRYDDDTYEFVGGPTWITVSSSGIMGGTPLSNDVGEGFMVAIRVIETSGITYDMHKMIDVLPGDPGEPGENMLPPATAYVPYNSQLPADGTAVVFTLVSAPGWVNIDSGGLMTGIPTNFDAGSGISIVVEATDDAGSVRKEFFIDVFTGDDPGGEPGEGDLPPAYVNRSYYFKVLSENADDTYTLVEGPAWLTIARTGELTGMPAAADAGMGIEVVVNVTAPDGSSHDIFFMLDVFEEDEPGPGDENLPSAVANIEYYFMLPVSGDGDTFQLIFGPGWLTFDPATGIFSGRPTNDDVGIYPVEITATSATGGSDTISLSIEVKPEDDPGGPEPGSNVLPPAYVNVEYYFMLSVSGTDLTFALVSGPGWLMLDPVTGEFSGMPAAEDEGHYSVEITVTDSVGIRTEHLSLDVNKEGDPGDPEEPGMYELPPAVAEMDYEFLLPFAEEGYTFEIISGPGWLNIDGVTGRLYGRPALVDVIEDYSVVIYVNDSAGGSEEMLFIIDVLPEGEPGIPGDNMLPPAVVNTDYYFMLPNQNPGDTFDLVRGPGWIMLDPVSGVFGGMPAAADEVYGVKVVINIKSADGEITERRFTMDVYLGDDPGGTGGNMLPPAIANMEYYYKIPERDSSDTFELTEAPDWMRINSENGQLSGMPTAATVGEMFPVNIVIYDAAGAPFEMNMTINVYLEGDPGVPGEKYLPPAFVDQEYYYMLPGRNPGDTFKLTSAPEWLTIDPKIGQFGGMPGPEDIGFGVEVVVVVTTLTGNTYKNMYMIEVFSEHNSGFESGEKYLPPAIVNMEYYFRIPFGGPEDTYELLDGPGWMRLKAETRELRGMPAEADVANGIPVRIMVNTAAGESFEEAMMIDVYPEGGGDGGFKLTPAVVNEPYYFMFPSRNPDDTFELTLAPEWLKMDSRTGQMTGLPAEADIGEDIPLAILISSVNGEIIEAKLFVTVYPEGSHGGRGLPPAYVGTEYSFFIPDDYLDAKYELAAGPGWLSLDPDIGEFTGIPADADVGEGLRVQFTITLRSGEIFEKSTFIDVYPEGGPGSDMFLPPAIAGIPYDFMLPKENIDDTIAIIEGPEWLTIKSRTAQFMGTPPETDMYTEYTVTVQVNGATSKAYEMKFILEVFPFGSRDDENHLPPATVNVEYYFMVPKIEVEGDVELITGPAWLTFDAATMIFGGMPADADIGEDFPVAVSIADSTGSNLEKQLMIDVYPEGGPQDDMKLPPAVANMPYYFKIPDMVPDEKIEMIESPEWLEFDSTTGQFSGLPTDGDVGYAFPVTFQINGTDGEFTETLSIDVLFEGGARGMFMPPASVNLPYDYMLPMGNPDDRFEIVEGPAWLRFDPNKLVFSGIPSREDIGYGIPVTVLITEATGESYEETLLLDVYASGRAGGDFLPPATANIQYYYLFPERNAGDTFDITKGPAWLTIDPRTAQMTGMPSAAYVGYGITVVILITSADGVTAEEDFMIDVFPAGGEGELMLPPGIANERYNHTFPKPNPDDVITVIDSPDWLRIDSKTGQMLGIPTDADVAYGIPVTVKIVEAIDSAGEGYQITYMLDVFPSGDFGGIYLPPAMVNMKYKYVVPMKNPDDTFTIGDGPVWLTADSATGMLTGMPAAADIGYGIPVTLLITGTEEIVHKETYMIDVIPGGGAANVAGLFLPPATATVAYSFTLPKKNPDDTFAIGEGPAWLSVASKTGILSGTPAETDAGYGIPVKININMRTGETTMEKLILDVFPAGGQVGDFLPPARVAVKYEYKVPKKNPDDVFEIVDGPSWLTIYSKSGLLTGIPSEEDAGYGIPVQLSVLNRTLGESYTADYLINVLMTGLDESFVNIAPTFNAATLKDAHEGSKYLEVLYVTDGNVGERLMYSKLTGPAWLTVNPSNGQLSGLPLQDDVGTDIVLKVIVTDAGGYADTLSTTLDVIDVENPPVFKTRKLWDATNGIAYLDTVEVVDPDISGETEFTFAIDSGPTWLSIDNGGILSGTPGNDDIGLKQPIAITATDGTGLSSTLNTVINVLSETRIESIVIAQPERVVRIGETQQYTAQVMTNYGTVAESAPVHWELIGDAGTIDDDGLFTAEKGGVGQIVASTTVVDKLISTQVPVTVFLEKFKLAKIRAGTPVGLDDLTYPLDFVKGARLEFSEDSLPEDIGIDVKLPSFASVDNENKKVTFGDKILSAVTFNVLVDEEDAGTYYFNEPIRITIPYDPALLASRGLTPDDLRIFYVDNNGDLIGDEIYDVTADSLSGTISAYVSHFSSFAFAAKYDGPALLGDYDYDMDVDFFDFTQLVTYWNADDVNGDLASAPSATNNAGPAPWWNNTYLYSGDSVVDFEDLTVFTLMYNWHQSEDSGTAEKPVMSKHAPFDSRNTGLAWDMKNYEIGDTLMVALNAGIIDNFVAAEMALNYDPSLLRVVDVKSSYARDYANVMTPVQFRESGGSLTASAITLGDVKEGVSLYGQDLFEVEFEVIGKGSMSIELADIDLRNAWNVSPVFKIANPMIQGAVGESNVPLVFELTQNYPNPFNMSTTINYSIDMTGMTNVSIYNTLGQKVRTLVNGNFEAGRYQLLWNGTDENGLEVSSGVYIITLRNNNRYDTKQILMLK